MDFQEVCDINNTVFASLSSRARIVCDNKVVVLQIMLLRTELQDLRFVVHPCCPQLYQLPEGMAPASHYSKHLTKDRMSPASLMVVVNSGRERIQNK